MQNTSQAFKDAANSATRESTCIVYFGVYDVTASTDATTTANTTKANTNPAQLTDNNRTFGINIGTFEDNFFKLDGTFQLSPNDLSLSDNIGWWSNEQCQANGTFLVPPVLTITFASQHSALGLGIVFDELSYSHAEDFLVQWYQNTTLLDSISITGNQLASINIEKQVQNFNKIVITFTKMYAAYRYLKLCEVFFGIEQVFYDKDIVKANLVEEVDPTSGLLSINKFSVTLLNEDQKFNMLNPDGIYAYLQRRQPLTVRSGFKLNDTTETVPMGVYYLDDWSNSTGITATLKATDIVGLLDQGTFYKSGFYNDEPIGNVIQAILADVGSINYQIDASASAETITGFIPAMSHRQALQMVLLASRCAGVIDRNNKLVVKKLTSTTSVKTIDNNLILGNPEITQKEFVSGVQATEYSYKLSAATAELFNSTFTLNGTQTFYLDLGDNPADVSTMVIAISGNGTISGTPTKTATTAIVTVIGTGSLTLTVNAKYYAITKKDVVVELPVIPAGEVKRIAKISDDPLIKNAKDVAQSVLDYLQKRIEQRINYSCDPALQSGDYVDVATMFSVNKGGIVESQEFDLVPALKAKVQVVG